MANWTEVETYKEALEAIGNGNHSIFVHGHRMAPHRVLRGEVSFTEVANALAVNSSCTCLIDTFIGDKGAKEISDSLKVNRTLTALTLHCNSIHREGAKEIAEMLKVNTSLASLELFDNYIYREGAREIADSLKVNTSLTSLYLKYSEIGFEGTKEITNALKVNQTLTELKLSRKAFHGLYNIFVDFQPGYRDRFGAKIGPEGAKQIADVLKVNTSLRSLSLRYYYGMGTGGVKHIADALRINQTLTDLEFKGMRIGPKGAEEIADALKVNKTLFSLSLRDDSLGSSGQKQIADMLKVNTSLTIVKLRNVRLGCAGAELIANVLRVNTSWTALNLEENLIGSKGAKEIADALKVNTSLTRLNLQWNLIGPNGNKEIAEALKVNRTLTSLTLSIRSYVETLGPEGAKEIANALKVNTSLIFLELGYHEIGIEGAKEFADALKVNTSLISLDLTGTDLGSEGARKIGDALKVNSSLTSLNLSKTAIGSKGAKEIANALKVNNTLAVLRLDGTKIGARGTKAIAGALNVNSGSALIKLGGVGVTGDVIGERHRQRFLDALKGNEKAEFSRLRVMFVGQGRAGKSATVRSMQNKKFTPEWDSTLGADVSEAVVANSKWSASVRGIDFTTALATRIMRKGKKEENSHIVVENVPASKSKLFHKFLKKKENRVRKVEQKLQTQNRKKVENSSPQHVVAPEDQKPENEEKLPRIDVVRKYDKELMIRAHRNQNGLALSLWDFGGQEVFYTMHHIFLTKTGIYVLVFNTRKLLGMDIKSKEEAKQYLLFWLRSINIHAPNAPVILVGTFCAEIQEEIRTADKILCDLCNSLNFMAQIRSNENLIFFPIDNKEGLHIEELRSAIETAAREDQSIKEQVSIRWMAFLDKLVSFKGSKSYLELNRDVNELAIEIGLSTQEREMALELFHERGLIFHLTATEALRNIVVIKPQWLITALAKVIRDSSVHVDLREFREAGLGEDVTELFEEGIASRDILEYLWKHDQIDFFIDLMKRTMLMSEYGGSGNFFIPSLLHDKHESCDIFSCIFDFSETFLPHGLFQRLVCLCMEYVSRGKARNDSFIVSKNFARFERFRGQKVELSEHDQIIRLSTSESANDTIAVMESMLFKINSNVLNDRLKWQTLVLDESTGNFEPWQEKTQIDSTFLNLANFLDSL